MLTHTIRLHKDKLTKDSKPLDRDKFFSMINHDPFNTDNPDLPFKYFSYKIKDLLGNTEMREKYGHYAKILTDFFDPDIENDTQMTVPSLSVYDFERFNPKKSGIFLFSSDELQSKKPLWILRPSDELLAIQLLWGDVRVEVIDEEKGKLGEWIAYAWSPLRNELYIFGRDFMPTEEIMNMETTPEGRGRPSDHIITGANCGPSSLAAYLNISTAEVIEHLPIFRKKGWVNPPHVVKALKQMGKEHTHDEYQRSDGKSLSDIVSEFGQGLAFTQYFYSKNEKISHTHWVAFDNHEDVGLVVYDVNVFDNIAYGKGNWVPLEEWENGVEAFVRENFRKQARYKKFDGYFVKDVIFIK